MLTLVIGNKGYGKSCYMTRELYYLSRGGYHIYANFKLKFKNTYALNLNNIDEMMEKSKIGIAIDEAPLYFDSRRSMSKENRKISYLLQQSRKRNTKIYLASQRMNYLDLRARFNFDFLAFVYPYTLQGNTLRRATRLDIFKEHVDYIKVKECLSENELLRTYYFPAKRYFKLYDTHEMFPILF